MSNNLKDKLNTFFINFSFILNDKNIFNANMVINHKIDQDNIQLLIEFTDHSKEIIEKINSKIKKELIDSFRFNSVQIISTSHKSNNQKIVQNQNSTQESIKNIKYIVAVASGKGGVGKSTTSINVALSLKNQGFKVGILDADIYGPSLPKLIGSNQKPQTDGKFLSPISIMGLKTMSIGFMIPEDNPTIWRGPMVISALSQMLNQVIWGELDYLIIDLPPGTGDVQLSLSQKANLTGAIVVSTPQDLALIDARKGINMFHKVDIPVLGIIENMSYYLCPSCGEISYIFSNGGAKNEAKKLSVDFLGAVPLDIEIRQGSDEGRPISEFSKNKNITSIYSSIASKVHESVEKIKKSNNKIIVE